MAAILQIIVIEASSEPSAATAQILSDYQQPYEMQITADTGGFQQLLTLQKWDIVIVAHQHQVDPLQGFIDISRQLQPWLGYIALIEDEALTGSGKILFNQGFIQLIHLRYPSTLIATIRREAELSQIKRELGNHIGINRIYRQRLDDFILHSPLAICYIHNHLVTYANPLFLETFGYYSSDAIIGLPFIDLISPSQQRQFKEFLFGYLKGRKRHTMLETKGIDIDGTTLNLSLRVSPVVYKGQKMLQLITSTQNSDQDLLRQLKEVKQRDNITGTYNRNYFLERLASEHQGNSASSLLLISADQFLTIRDKFGIDSGDAILAELAEYVQQNRPHEEIILARYDGHRLVMLIEGCDQPQAEKVGKRLLNNIRETLFGLGSHTSKLTLSIGIVTFDRATENHIDALSRLENAHQKASEQGGNHLVSYKPQHQEIEVNHQLRQLAHEIKESLRNNSFKLFYQPIVSLKEDTYENYEILLRMPLAQNEQLANTRELFSAANSAGLTIAIDRWVVGNAIKALINQRNKGTNLRFFVKLSAETITSGDSFLDWVGHISRTARLESNVLIMNIDDAIIGRHKIAVKTLISGLRKLNIGIAIDNFGLGRHPLTSLDELKIQFIKITPELVSGMGSDMENSELIQQISQYAARQKIQVVANAVEDSNTLSLLYSSGIDFISGYFVQEPRDSMDYTFEH